MKKTRFVLISDTHSTYPKLPAADVIIHAGDATNQGTFSELKKTLDWLDKAEAEVKIIIAGNHDITLDTGFYAEYGLNFHNQYPQDPDDCLALMNSYPGIIYLHHSSRLIQLKSPKGPHTAFRVFGSPYVPAGGLWAFGYDQKADTGSKLWRDIPLNTDIVVTHTPAYNHRDASPKWGAAGCEELRRALWRIRPKLAVCGHVHEARGVETVTWKTGLPFTPFLEEKTVQWSDPGARSKKLSLMDLTAKGGMPLKNDGSDTRPVFATPRVSFSGGEQHDGESAVQSQSDTATLSTHVSGTTSAAPGSARDNNANDRTKDQCEPPEQISGVERKDVSVLNGRQGRKQTCIVNAAIMAKSWGKGAKEYNKPIVVDLDLPIWKEGKDEDHSLVSTSGYSGPTVTRHTALVTSEIVSM